MKPTPGNEQKDSMHLIRESPRNQIPTINVRDFPDSLVGNSQNIPEHLKSNYPAYIEPMEQSRCTDIYRDLSASRSQLSSLQKELSVLEKTLESEKRLASAVQVDSRETGIARERVHVLEEIYRSDLAQRLREKEAKDLELSNLIIEEQLLEEEMRLLQFQLDALGAIRADAEREVLALLVEQGLHPRLGTPA